MYVEAFLILYSSSDWAYIYITTLKFRRKVFFFSLLFTLLNFYPFDLPYFIVYIHTSQSAYFFSIPFDTIRVVDQF